MGAFSLKSWNSEGLKDYIQKRASEEKNESFSRDERIWQIEIPKEGDKTKYSYKLRYLPVVDEKLGSLDAVVKVFVHEFKSPVNGKHTTVSCPNTIKKPCPICSYATELWQSGNPTDMDQAKKYFRKTKYYTNILVIKEAEKTTNYETRKANEGKVFIYKFGPKIDEKLQNCMFPPSGDEGVVYSDPIKGLDFNLVAQMKDGFLNYDASEFTKTTRPIADTDEEFNEILSSVYRLDKEILAPSNFPSEEEIQKTLEEKILGKSSESRPSAASTPKRVEPKKAEKEDVPTFAESDKPIDSKPTKVESAPKAETSESDDDFLKQLEAELGNI